MKVETKDSDFFFVNSTATKAKKYAFDDSDDHVTSEEDTELRPIENNGTDHRPAVLSDSDDEILPRSKSA